MSVQASINQAAKETVRFASVRGFCERRGCNRGRDRGHGRPAGGSDHRQHVGGRRWDPDNSPGSVVTVDIQTSFAPAILLFGPSSYTFTSTASMTIVR